MNTIRPRQHDRCPSCGRYAFDVYARYCMTCGFSERNPMYGVLIVCGVGLGVLAFVGWLMS